MLSNDLEVIETVEDTSSLDISVLLPAYNEANNLPEVIPEIEETLKASGKSYEIVVIDDGSTDDTRAVMRGLASDTVRCVSLRRNSGKSAALDAGFEEVIGDVVVLMDADGQDDPGEIVKMIDVLDHGVDLVTGRRSIRQDRFIKRNTSKIYNKTTTLVTGVEGKDFNSGFKAMRKDVAKSLNMYGELHRYIPVLAAWNGFRVQELDVRHHARRHGKSKFGKSRFTRGMLDLITVKFLTTYTARPFHLFGGMGFMVGAIGLAILAWMLISQVMGQAIGDRPALLAGILLVVVSVQLMSLGLIGELIIHGRKNNPRQ
jgi:glycosyltransferase involved in cell wall biosynthesis